MEKTIVTTGKTIDLAIEAALTQLGLDRDSVSVTVLQQASWASVHSLPRCRSATRLRTRCRKLPRLP